VLSEEQRADLSAVLDDFGEYHARRDGEWDNRANEDRWRRLRSLLSVPVQQTEGEGE
jgi:hypothetical protein